MPALLLFHDRKSKILHFYIFRFHEVSPEIENYHPHISVNLCKPTHKEERTSESWEIGSVEDLNSIPKIHVKKTRYSNNPSTRELEEEGSLRLKVSVAYWVSSRPLRDPIIKRRKQ